jgi:hypothetical protein
LRYVADATRTEASGARGSAAAGLVWQTWRWTARTAALLRTGSGYLPRAVDLPAARVERIANRKLLFAQAGTRRLRWLAGRVVAGDWDLATSAVADHPALLSFRRRFEEGAEWEETAYWHQIAADVHHGTPRIGCRSVSDLERKFRGFDELWEAVGTPDYRRSGGLAYRPWEEVLVALARDGSAVLVDGRHRLIIAHLKRCALPVLVILRHAQAPPAAG